MKLLVAVVALGAAGAGIAQLYPAVQPLAGPPAPLPAALASGVRELEPVGQTDCIRFIDAVNAESAGATILWRTGRKLAYRSDTTGGCFGLKRHDRIVIETIKGRVCKGDFVRTVDRTSGAFTGSCALGPFVRYASPDRR